MRKFSLFLVLGGAALAALSFLFIYLKLDPAGYIMLAAGILLIIAGCALVFRIFKKTEKKLIPDGARYGKKQALLTVPEINLLYTLRGMLDGRRYEVFPQISLNAVIDKQNAAYRNELFRLADFCITDAGSFEPLLLIELNDSSHNRDDRRLRDEKVRAICAAAKMPIVSLTLDEASDQRCVRDRLRKYVKVK